MSIRQKFFKAIFNLRGLLFLFIIIFSFSPTTMAENIKKEQLLRKTADFYLKAVFNREYEICLRMIDPLLINDLGGEAKVIEYLKQGRNQWEEMEWKHFEIVSVSSIEEIKDEQYAIINYLITLEAPGGEKTYLELYFLAYSRIGFEYWYLTNGDQKTADTLKRYSISLYEKLNPPNLRMYSADKSIDFSEINGEWVPTEDTLRLMKKLVK